MQKPNALHTPQARPVASLICFTWLCAALSISGQPAAGTAQMDEQYGKFSLHFEPNQGQAYPHAKFISRGSGYAVYLEDNEVFLLLQSGQESHRDNVKRLPATSHAEKRKEGTLRVKLDGADEQSRVAGEEEMVGKSHYFIGNDPALWRTNIQHFAKVRYRQVYPGVDLVFYGNQRQLEYDFVVAPGADPKLLQFDFNESARPAIDPKGDLLLQCGTGDVRFHKPVIYQTIGGIRREIQGNYELRGSHKVGFELGLFDKSETLVIDPILSYSTFIGGSQIDALWRLTVDASGNAYIVGETISLTNLITAGAYQTNYAGGFIDNGNEVGGDAFVGKLNPSGTAFLYMTYLGGSTDDSGLAIAVDAAGNAYVTGYTDSANFPTKNAFQPHIHGTPDPFFGLYPTDGFLTKLNTNGSALIYSTYLGGDLKEDAYAIAVDAAGYVYVAGYTESANFPTTNAIKTTLGGTDDAFVAKFNPSGSNLVYSTYLGGTALDQMSSIALDGATNLWVVGVTASTNFTTTTNAYQTTNKGGYDCFLTQLSSTGTIIYSTYLGGGHDDLPVGITLDAAGNIYICGSTLSTNFPITNALQSVLNGTTSSANKDGFLLKLNPTATALLYSTYLGGTNNDDAVYVAVQTNGNVVVVGQTGSIDFAPFIDYGSINHGGFDAYVAQISSSGTALLNFAYLGGTNIEYVYGLGLDGAGNIYVCGMTASPDFPITSTNVPQSKYRAGTSSAGYVAKLSFSPDQLGTRVIFSQQDTSPWSGSPAASLAASNIWSSVGGIPAVSTNGITGLLTRQFQRGSGYDPTYTSFVIPLDSETGIKLDDTGDNSSKFAGSRPWFTLVQKDTRIHLNFTSSTTNSAGGRTNFYSFTTNFDNPIAAFGSDSGGTPLYVNQNYRLGMYCGGQYESTNSDGTIFQTPLRILVYRKSDFTAGQTNVIAPFATNTITLPRRTISSDQASWAMFATNGFTTQIESNGLRTTVRLVEEQNGAWGVIPQFANARSGPFLITHQATSTTNLYVVEGIGVVPFGSSLYPMVTNTSGGVGWDRLYSVDFDTRPPWRAVFIDQPHFDGAPLPSFYQGKSASEMTNLVATLTNFISLSASVYTNVGNSPELLRHPILDNLVSDMQGDPIALANYVVNEIELTDALAYDEVSGQASAAVINQGGINRGALGVFLEGQGSPTEQCALLVYLLRQAGFPAAYVFPTNNNVQMLDIRLSQLLRMQVKGALNGNGQSSATNSLITVNYPWVAVNISNNCYQVFPWLKQTEIVEGLNLYDYMPTNYDNGAKWLRNYLYADTNILSLSAESDALSVLFPKFIKRSLLATAPGISLDDIGTKAFNRRNFYARWQDFPTPSVINNQSQVVPVDSLTSASIINVSPALTNIFNTVDIEVYSLANTNTRISTGQLRISDLHDRKMFIATNSSTSLMLWLAPYRSDNTNQSAFDVSDPALTNKQVKTVTLSTNDQNFGMTLTHNRHRALNFVPGPNQYLGISETLQFTTPERPVSRADVTAICLDMGQVSPRMLDVHASAFRQMDYKWQLNTNVPPALEDYQGTAAYLMGMDYYAKVSRFARANEQLHKSHIVSWLAQGLSKLTPFQLGIQNFVRPSLDMFFNEIAHAANSTLRPDQGNDFLAGTDDFSRILMGEIAAQEHNLVNGYFRSTNAISAVVLLRLAQQRSGSGVAGIVELDKNGYIARGNSNSPGYGPTRLKDYDSNMWSAVTNAFQNWDSDYVRAYLTPGPVNVQLASFRGMGLVIVGRSQSSSLISLNMNGVLGEQTPYFADSPASLSTAYADDTPSSGGTFSANLDASSLYGAYLSGGNLYGGSLYGGNVFDAPFDSYYWTTPYWYSSAGHPFPFVLAPPNFSTAQGTAAFTSPSQIDLGRQVSALYYTPVSTPPVTSLSRALDSGNSGLSTWKNLKNYVADPVNALSGEFYHPAVDVNFSGAMPFQLQRNYSSQNQGDRNNFGYGWNINLVPYMTVATNANNNIVLSAIEFDGSVIAYRQQTNDANLFLANLQDNPHLDNFGGGKIGSVYNPFNGRIRHSVSGTNEFYALNGANGHIRTFQVRSFPVVGPTNTITRQRPYLSTWQDSEGNTCSFTFQTDSTAVDYGQLVRIQSSSGAYVELAYNAGGYVTEAFTGDGQEVDYEYNDFGDLIRVVLPDFSEETYEYQHNRFTNNGAIYIDSTHLLIKQIKPDGRLLENVFDNQRRVIIQKATVGTDLNSYTNAVFTYSNNFALTNMITPISGFTVIKDVNGNTNRYDYTNSLVTKITDQLGQTIQQLWYADNAVAPGYPRSPQRIIDKRGLTNNFSYDASGNVLTNAVSGDLMGDVVASAVSSASYNSNNLPTLAIDSAGNRVQFIFDATFPYLIAQEIAYAGASPIITNLHEYTSVTNTFANGGTLLTNIALGVPKRLTRAINSPDAAVTEWTFDSRGFPSQLIQYTGTSDPNVTHNFVVDGRGNLLERTDAAGRKIRFGYDDLNRLTSVEVFEAGQNIPIYWDYYYYNENGQLVWSDGPRFDPEDYVWHDYDGAGRETVRIQWRCQAKPDGSGVQAPAGDALFATTFFAYDKFGNQIKITNPRGIVQTNAFDGLGQLLMIKVIETNGVILATNSLAYEPGGLISFFTNALGGVTEKRYTSRGQLKYQKNPDASTNGFRYYIDGRVSTNFLSNGAYWQTSYDDANRRTTRVFFSAANARIATNIVELDRRGNLLKSTDVEGFVSTNQFDGLDRAKIAAGPAMVTTTLNWDRSGYITNVSQQVITNVYDASGQILNVYNALGEKAVSRFDAIGRSTSAAIYNSDGTLARTNSTAYSANLHSYTTTAGSGTNALITATFTDNEGQPVLAQHFPVFGQASPLEFTLQSYDLMGNLAQVSECSASNGVVTTWATNLWAFDGLNRPVTETVKDGATTTFAYNNFGNLTNRAMPDGLNWSATFNSAGQILTEKLTGGGLTSRAFSYSYYSAGNANVGLLQTLTDGRGVAKSATYDDFLRPYVISASGTNNEYNLTITSQFDRRGFLTNTVQSFGSTNTGPQTRVRRVYDAYGEMLNEYVSIASEPERQAAQTWNNAGRRTALFYPGVLADFDAFSFGYRADGQMKQLIYALYTTSYTYGDNGLLQSKANDLRSFSIDQRDGRGRVSHTTTSVQGSAVFTESLGWRNDGRMISYSAVRGDFTDARSYGYSAFARRLTNESLTVGTSLKVTNSFGIDFGQSAKLGVLTSAAQSGAFASSWTAPSVGGLDGLRRLSQDQSTLLERPATGRAVGAGDLSGTLNGRPVPVQYDSANTNGTWRANMQLSPGQNTFIVSATHPSHLYTTGATNIYTNLISAADALTNNFDGNGNFTLRTKRDGSNNVVTTQTLIWDANDRLVKVTERDSQNSGYDWTATYDPLGRRLRTTQTLIVTNSAQPSPIVLDSWYDPEVEFLEVGVSVNGERHWRAYGPDLSGSYGGMQGAGGIEAILHDSALDWGYDGAIADQFGDVLAKIDFRDSSVTWFPTRVGAYGPVAGYPALPLERNEAGYYRLQPTLTWRGLRIDPTGFYWMGARYYDPETGHFLSSDPMGFFGGSDLQGFCQGDPVNFFDADGRLGKASGTSLNDTASGFNRLLGSAYGSIGYIGMYPFSRSVAERWYGRQARGLANTITGSAQTAYDAAAFASYEILSPLAPEQTARAYAPALDRLDRVVNGFTGGEGHSGAYRSTYTVLNAATLVVGGEAGNLGKLGRLGDAGAEITTAEGLMTAQKTVQLSPILQTQKQLSQLVNRQGAVIDRWLRTSDNRWAQAYRSGQKSNPNFASGIRGRILDIRMRSLFREAFGDSPGVRIDQTIPGSGNTLRPDLYFPSLDGSRVIFDVGSPSKLESIEVYSGMADYLIPLVPDQWIH